MLTLMTRVNNLDELLELISWFLVPLLVEKSLCFTQRCQHLWFSRSIYISFCYSYMGDTWNAKKADKLNESKIWLIHCNRKDVGQGWTIWHYHQYHDKSSQYHEYCDIFFYFNFFNNYNLNESSWCDAKILYLIF